ncbi:MAG TPA: non-homologous end-joining DNA ligase, partial [Lysobacter sp.]
MALQEYHRKRRFSATPEPRGATATPRKRKALAFVVQLHHARARHYDFRLEVDGVLHSWAVPKGPSLRPGEKRLAVEVEDHPLSYGSFEGTIPEGNYGAGHVAIFDHGTWEPEGDPADAIRRGKLEFELRGDRLKGGWKLVRTAKPASKPQWLLFKRSDDYAADLEADDLLEAIPAPPADAPGASTAKGRRILAMKATNPEASVKTKATASGRKTTRTVAGKTTKAATTRATTAGRKRSSVVHKPDIATLRARALELAGKRRARTGEFLPPMLTVSAKVAPAGEHWLHEWKWDGYRIVAQGGDEPRLWSRNGLSWNDRVPELVQALSKLEVPALLDGELIAVDERGYSDFNALQQALKTGNTAQLRYAVFDLLSFDGIDLTQVPLVERKALLEQLLQGADARLFYSGHVVGHGPDVFEAARGQGMEGIISKHADSTYGSGRSDRWLKIKAVETREFIVVGYTQPKGSRKGIGALLLAQRKGNQLVYAGRVGSGLSDAMLQDLPRQLARLESETATVPLPPHTPLPPGKVHWVRPAMVVEVIFRGWGNEGLLRQASFHRLRADKPAGGELDDNAAGPAAPLPTLSSPGRVVYPDSGYTKQDVFDYYLAAADQILGDISGRLLSIVRCPKGIDGQHFFQKHAGPGFG